MGSQCDCRSTSTETSVAFLQDFWKSSKLLNFLVTMALLEEYDMFIVGAGFGGIYQLSNLTREGYRVKLIDIAGGPGGTWWCNRYLGAQSDTESFVYRYSWDKENLYRYAQPEHYTTQPQAQAFNAIVPPPRTGCECTSSQKVPQTLNRARRGR